jgi:hypothetical protein
VEQWKWEAHSDGCFKQVLMLDVLVRLLEVEQEFSVLQMDFCGGSDLSSPAGIPNPPPGGIIADG